MGASLAVYLALFLLLLIGALSSPHFLTVRNLTNILRQSSPLLIVSIGQTYLILSGEIDLSVGSVISLTSSTACMLMLRGGGEWTIIGVLAALGIGALIGLVNGLITVTRKVPSFVVTLGMMSIVHGAALIVTGGYPKGRASSYVVFFGERFLGPMPYLFVISFIILVISIYFLRKTRFGTYTYALGANPEAANLSGIRIIGHSLKVFTLCGFMAGLAGLALAARIGVGDPFVGAGYDLDSIAAVVMGGTALGGGIGGLTGTFVGVLIIATIRNLLNLLDVSAFYQHVVQGSVLIFAVSIYIKNKS